MKNLIFTSALALVATPALATIPNNVPEMSASAGVAAVALLIGVAAIIRERSKRK